MQRSWKAPQWYKLHQLVLQHPTVLSVTPQWSPVLSETAAAEWRELCGAPVSVHQSRQLAQKEKAVSAISRWQPSTSPEDGKLMMEPVSLAVSCCHDRPCSICNCSEHLKHEPRDKAAQELGEEAMRLEDAAHELELRVARAKHDAEEAWKVAAKLASGHTCG